MPPSPISLIISYWLIRTPACGTALPACTPVEPESNVSHAERLTPDGALDDLRAQIGAEKLPLAQDLTKVTTAFLSAYLQGEKDALKALVGEHEGYRIESK